MRAIAREPEHRTRGAEDGLPVQWRRLRRDNGAGEVATRDAREGGEGEVAGDVEEVGGVDRRRGDADEELVGGRGGLGVAGFEEESGFLAGGAAVC